MNKPILACALLALAIAGCAKKPPKELPPPPATGGDATPITSNETGAPVPGSQADFVAKVVSDRIYFATDSSDVDAEDQATLRSQAQWLAQYPRVRVTIEGHADERGTREYNIALGERRANATKNALAALGVDPGRMTVISYGKERPEAMGSDEAAWAKNRRAVTVTVQ
jgi:peptidoglycan-associated lipoprotein